MYDYFLFAFNLIMKFIATKFPVKNSKKKIRLIIAANMRNEGKKLLPFSTHIYISQ